MNICVLRKLAWMLSLVFSLSTALAVDIVPAQEIEPLYEPRILEIPSEVPVSELESQGILVWGRRGDLVLGLIPVEKRNKKHASAPFHPFPPKRKPLMDVAKTHFRASDIHSGTGLQSPFTGKGVVVGLVDCGLDPGHIAFKDSRGNPRVKKAVWLNELTGSIVTGSTPDEILAMGSDHPDDYHGTHVCGIMASSYRGNDYWGMAPDADIVMTSCEFYDAGILAACEQIVDYAKSVGKPTVINLSLGGYNGPHDGSSLFCRYMEMLGEDAIVCMASGNEAGRPSTFSGVLGPDGMEWSCLLGGNDWSHFNVSGMTDIWVDDDRPLSLSLFLFDKDLRHTVWRSPVFGKEGDFETDMDLGDIPVSPAPASGQVYIKDYASPLNGRRVLELYYDFSCPEGMAGHPNWARYHVGISVANPNPAPVKIDAFADCQSSRLYSLSGFAPVTSDMSVSDIATGKNVVCVGMYSNRSQCTHLDGSAVFNNGEVLAPSVHSGYGVLPDGSRLPHVVAPGSMVVSSVSRHFIESAPEAKSGCVAREPLDGQEYHWMDSTGTSMSCPYTAGVIACWLEADPTLAVGDVLHIISATNLDISSFSDDPRSGGGWLAPYDGMKLVAERVASNVPGRMEACMPSALFNGSTLEILNPSGASFTAALHSPEGRCVYTRKFSGIASSTVDISDYAPGVWILTLSSAEGIKTLKIHR